MFEGIWRGQRVAVEKLPPLESQRGDGPTMQSQHEALIAEIKLHSRFQCSRLVG